MYSIAFPNMFNTSRTYTLTDYDATLSNLKLVLRSERYALYGDPYYGTNLEQVIYSQVPIIKDLIIDEIYTAIITFIPQLIVNRSDIDVYVGPNNQLFTSIKATSKIDYTNNLYSINLTETNEY